MWVGNHMNNQIINLSDLDFLDNISEQSLVKKLFSNVPDNELQLCLRELKESALELKCQYKQKFYREFITHEELMSDLSSIVSKIQYKHNTIGNKLEFLLAELVKLRETTDKYNEDFVIIKVISDEYLQNKKILKSNMLYLNKIYKEINLDYGIDK